VARSRARKSSKRPASPPPAACAHLEDVLDRLTAEVGAQAIALTCGAYRVSLRRTPHDATAALLDKVLALDAPELDPSTTNLKARTVRYRLRDSASGPLLGRLIATALVDPYDVPLGSVIVVRDGESGVFDEAQQARVRALAKEASGLIVAHYDPATGLLSRGGFEQRLGTWRATADARPAALLYADVDRLHALNQLQGLEAGDAAIAAIGERLHDLELPEGALACHLTADRFVVFLPNTTVAAARSVGQAFIERVAAIRHSISVGIAPMVEGEPLNQTLSAAASACRAAKDRGRGRVECFEDADQSIIRRNADVLIAGALRTALAEDRIELVAQRIVRLRGEETERQVELLVRLVGEGGRLIPPAEFLSAAQRYDLLPELDRAVVRRALARLAAHRDAITREPLRASVNLSGPTLSDPAFADWLADELDRTGVPGSWLQVEITETAAVANVPQTTKLIEVLAARGIRFALDDFGTGMSSLAYLKAFNVRVIKIADVFVRDLATDARSRSLVGGLAQLARSMDIETVAEAVETPVVLAQVEKLGVDCAQGFLYGEPIPFDQLIGATPAEPAVAAESRSTRDALYSAAAAAL
jgi:diguanylate cyclase (GGDEF)-like protein